MHTYHQDKAIVVRSVIDEYLLAFLVREQSFDLVGFGLGAEEALGFGVVGMIQKIKHGCQSNVVCGNLFLGV